MKKTTVFFLVLIAILTVFLSTNSFASLMISGDAQFVSPPASVAYNVYESDVYFRVFSEFSGISSQDITVDVGDTIPMSTQINSYFVHADPLRILADTMVYNGTLTFESESIIGLILNGYKLNDTNSVLGAIGTNYTDWNPRYRGVNGPDEHADIVDLIDNQTLSLQLVTRGMDQMRIITSPTHPVPEPSTVFIFAAGLIGIAGFRKNLRNKL